MTNTTFTRDITINALAGQRYSKTLRRDAFLLGNLVMVSIPSLFFLPTRAKKQLMKVLRMNCHRINVCHGLAKELRPSMVCFH